MTRAAQVRLVNYALRPTHYVYRGDMGGGGNHPRTWVLEGSVDGVAWTTLREPPRGRRPRPGFIFYSRAGDHRDDTSVTNTSAGQWPLDGKEFYSHLRVKNCGRPNHLCCSGIDFYGDVVERPGAGAAPGAPPAGPGFAKVAPAAGRWSEHQNIDMCGQGDVEIIHNWRSTHSVDDLKRIVEQKGYSAVCVGSFGHAALKKFPYQLTPGHCKPSRGYTNTLYIWENGGGAVTAQPQAVKSYQPGDLSARAVKGCYVGSCCIPIIWTAFHITPVSDDEFEDCGCAGRRGTRASRRDPFTRQVPCSVPSRFPGAARSPARARGGSPVRPRPTPGTSRSGILTSRATASAART